MAVSETPGYTRENPSIRRRALIEATLVCLARGGIAEASLRNIAREAGVTAGLVRHHFDGKEHLVQEAYRFLSARLLGHIAGAADRAEGNDEARLRAFVSASFRAPALDPEVLQIWLTFWSLVRSDEGIREIHHETYRRYRHVLEELMAPLLDRPGAAETRRAAIALSALLDGLWLEWCLDPRSYTAEEAESIAQDWVDALLRGALRLR